MKLKGQLCSKCKGINYKLNYDGLHILFLSSVECKQCHKKYGFKGALPGMSTQYVDVIFKVVLFLVAIYYIILKWLPGVIYMIVLFLLLNFIINPVLFKLGFILIDKEVEK
jgi:hypothetical protein